MIQFNDLNPQPDDLVVVPEDMVVPEQVPFHIYRMKFLHQPSIIRSGGYSMGFLQNLSFEAIRQWLGSPRHSLKEELFHNDKLRDSEMPGLCNSGLNEKGQPQVTDVQNSWFQNQVLSYRIEEARRKNKELDTKLQAMLDKASAAASAPDAEWTNWPFPTEVVLDPANEADQVPIAPELTSWKKLPEDVRKTDLPKFWRYVRPFDQHQYMSGVKKEVSPKGGVAFYIELDAENKTFAFSYAMCHTNENFNYSVARNICRQRFDSEDWYEVKNFDSNKGVVENIGVAICNLLYNQNPDEDKETVFSSLSDRFNEQDFKQLYKRI